VAQTPSTINICRRRGDTFPFVVVVRDENGDAINISGFSYLLTVDPSDAPTDALSNLFQLTGTIIDAANGRVQFQPTAGNADNVGDYFHDIQQTDGGGDIRTIAVGTFQFVQDITK
jgi:hypothetical protein